MDKLKQLINAIDNHGYKSYKQLVGDYQFPDFLLRIDHVQGDPFADPSRCRIFIKADKAAVADTLFNTRSRTIALEDFLGRSFMRAIDNHVKGGRGDGMSGEMSIVQYGQEVLERNALLIHEGNIELRIRIGLPADKRTVNAKQANIMLFEELPAVIAAGLEPLVSAPDKVKRHVNSVDDQQALRQQLSQHNLVAFIADGACLPRLSGIDDKPLPDAVLFKAPETLVVTLNQPHGGVIRGMGIPEGISLIVGGGFHGKSTLLHALERGVYDHIPGDGREKVVTISSAVKIRAEDRRAITEVDISYFISNLPQGKDTHQFTTQDASGSTSQAANIMEALSVGTKMLLIDEDTSATNFMIRDERMQALVSKDKEPITPLVQRVQDLKRNNDVSVILVMGGSGDFFGVAETVIMMDNYYAKNVTDAAKALAHDPVPIDVDLPAVAVSNIRSVQSSCLSPKYQAAKEKIQAIENRILRYGQNDINVSQVEQLVDEAQLTAIGYLIRYFYQLNSEDDSASLDMVVGLREALTDAEQQGLDFITPYITGTLAMP
ncbi:MAG: ABC-ATPase domain-containing protein, partial [Gammaproteobacteria bacterium]|nr:ABC-ATPase domain-containing protein [Gammaproteobacteria bacterium]